MFLPDAGAISLGIRHACVQSCAGVVPGGMLARMHNVRDIGRIPDPRTHMASDQPSSPGGSFGERERKSRLENPSLDHYNDLRFDQSPRRGHRRWIVVLAGLLLLVFLVILGVMAAIYWQARHDEARPVDAIVVMGAAQFNGRPSEVLEARLDHALALYREGLAPVIIVTGGKQPGDVYTEAGTSEQYLLDRGVPADAILMEDTGDDTWASIQNVADVVKGHDIQKVLLVSDGFHLFRSERMANAVGFDAFSSPAPNSPIEPWSGDEFSYVIRETGAVILQAPEWLF